MLRFFVVSMVGLFVAAGAARAAELCGHGCSACKAGCESCAAGTCGEQVMYEEREVTCYKTVFEEVRETKQVPATKYVTKTEYRMVPWTCQTCQTGEACAAGEAAASCAASCAPCAQSQPTTCLRKVPVEVLVEVPYTKTVETKRMVEKQVPYTIICCTAHPVTCVAGCGDSPAPAAVVGGSGSPMPLAPAPQVAPAPVK